MKDKYKHIEKGATSYKVEEDVGKRWRKDFVLCN